MLDTAQKLARGRLKAASAEEPGVRKAARNLILTEDFALMAQLLRHAREAISGYSDEELAVMISAKRIGDYKEALARRNILSMDSPGTYGWILRHDRRNREAIGRLPSFEELFAHEALAEMARG